jgi:hypothetical protein
MLKKDNVSRLVSLDYKSEVDLPVNHPLKGLMKIQRVVGVINPKTPKNPGLKKDGVKRHGAFRVGDINSVPIRVRGSVILGWEFFGVEYESVFDVPGFENLNTDARIQSELHPSSGGYRSYRLDRITRFKYRGVTYESNFGSTTFRIRTVTIKGRAKKNASVG